MRENEGNKGGARLWQWRVKDGYSQKIVAGFVNEYFEEKGIKRKVNYQKIHRIERGKDKKLPDDQLAAALAHVFWKDPSELIHLFDEDREALYISGAKTPQALAQLQELYKKEEQDRLVEYASQRLTDIGEVSAQGLPRLANAWSRQLVIKLDLATTTLVKSSNILACWPLYKLLTRALYAVGATYTNRLGGGEAAHKLLEVAAKLESVALTTGHLLPSGLAKSLQGEAYYLEGKHLAANKYVTKALEQGGLPVHVEVDLLRRKAVSLAKMGNLVDARELARRIQGFWDNIQPPSAFAHHMSLEGVARIKARLGSREAYGFLEQAAAVRDDRYPLSRLMEIRTILETKYYLNEPDADYVEELKDEAKIIAGQHDRHRKQVEDAARKALSLINVPRRPKAFPGFSGQG